MLGYRVILCKYICFCDSCKSIYKTNKYPGYVCYVGIWVGINIIYGNIPMRKRVIITNNREIYSKFKNLFIVQEVLFRNIKKGQIEKIVKGINKDNKVLDIENIGDNLLVKRVGYLNFEIYLK